MPFMILGGLKELFWGEVWGELLARGCDTGVSILHCIVLLGCIVRKELIGWLRGGKS